MARNKSLFHISISLGILFINLCFFHFCSPTQETKGKEDKAIKIGSILPLSGPSSYLGQSVRQGMELAFLDFNRTYNSNYKLDIHDTQGKASIAANIYRLLQSKNSNKVVLSWMSSAASTLVELSEKDKVVLFMGAAKPDLTVGKNYAIRIWPHAFDLAKLEADFSINQLKSKNVGIFYINDDYGEALNDEFKRIFTNNGGNVVFDEPISPEIIDYKEVIAKYKNKKIDLLYIPAYDKVYLYIIRSIRQYLSSDVNILADLTFCNYNTLRDIKAISEGIYTVGTEIDNKSTRNYKSLNLIKRINKQFNRRADFNSGLGYDMAWIALESFHNSANKKASEIVSYILNKKYFDGACGKIYFNKKGDSKYKLYFLKIENGELKQIEAENKDLLHDD